MSDAETTTLTDDEIVTAPTAAAGASPRIADVDGDDLDTDADDADADTDTEDPS